MIIDPRGTASKAATEAVMAKIVTVIAGERLDVVAGALMNLLLAASQQLLQMRANDRIVSMGAAGDDAVIRATMVKWAEMLRAMSEHPDPQLLPDLRNLVARLRQTSGNN